MENRVQEWPRPKNDSEDHFFFPKFGVNLDSSGGSLEGRWGSFFREKGGRHIGVFDFLRDPALS